MDLETILAVVKALNNRGVNYIIVGGVALNFQGLARATADIDLFIEPSAENISRLRDALRTVFEDPSIDEITVDVTDMIVVTGT